MLGVVTRVVLAVLAFLIVMPALHASSDFRIAVVSARLDEQRENLLLELIAPRAVGPHQFALVVDVCRESDPGECDVRVIDAAKTAGSGVSRVSATIPIKGSVLMAYGEHYFRKSDYAFAGASLQFERYGVRVEIPWDLARFGPPVKQ